MEMVIKMKKFLFIWVLMALLSANSKAQDISDIVADAASNLEENTPANDENSVQIAIEEDVGDSEEAPVVGITLVNEEGKTDAAKEYTSEDDDIIFGDDDYQEETEINPKKSLTENLTRNVKSDDEDKKEKSDSLQNNWMDKLITANSKKDSSSGKGYSLLGDMVEESKVSVGNSRSNASVFDISGVMLRMTLAQADTALQKRGYKKITQKLEIPNFIKWRNEELCRGSGVVGYERLGNCVKQKAQKDHYEYVESATYSKFDTKESMEIHLTSSFTGNKIYKIIYRSESTFIRGSSQKAAYLRNIKIYDFWKKINQKYGAPDNRDDVLWGLGGNKPYMHAKTGFLLLEDPMLRELDYTRMSREDQRFINTDIYTF